MDAPGRAVSAVFEGVVSVPPPAQFPEGARLRKTQKDSPPPNLFSAVTDADAFRFIYNCVLKSRVSIHIIMSVMHARVLQSNPDQTMYMPSEDPRVHSAPQSSPSGPAQRTYLQKCAQVSAHSV